MPALSDAAASRSPQMKSVTVIPSQPHVSRSTVVSRYSFWPHHSPLTELYAPMTAATPWSTTRSKCGRYTSWSVGSSAVTSTVKRAFSMELSA